MVKRATIIRQSCCSAKAALKACLNCSHPVMCHIHIAECKSRSMQKKGKEGLNPSNLTGAKHNSKGTGQHSTAQHSTAQHSTAQKGLNIAQTHTCIVKGPRGRGAWGGCQPCLPQLLLHPDLSHRSTIWHCQQERRQSGEPHSAVWMLLQLHSM